jgi:acyl carrier protein
MSESTTDLTALQQELLGFIVGELVPSGGSAPVTADEDLIKRGVIDSLGVAQLVEFCESRYGIRVSDTDLVPGNFRTVRELADFVDRKQAEQGSGRRARLRSRLR